MKNIILISFLIVLLTACAAPIPSSTATVTVSPTFTSTAIPEAIFTLTPTPIPMASNSDREVVMPDLEPSYTTGFVTQNFDGVNITFVLTTDSGLSPQINKVLIGEHPVNGLAPKEALASFISHAFYKVWDADHDGGYEDFVALWKTAQESNKKDDWDKVALTVKKVNRVETEGYDSVTLKMYPMCSVDFLDGDSVSMQYFEIAFVRPSKIKNMLFFDDEKSDGIGNNYSLQDGSFTVYVTSYARNWVDAGTEKRTIEMMSGIPKEMMGTLRGSSPFDTSLVKILLSKNDVAAIKIFK